MCMVIFVVFVRMYGSIVKYIILVYRKKERLEIVNIIGFI